jgi:hypothetical protein
LQSCYDCFKITPVPIASALVGDPVRVIGEW